MEGDEQQRGVKRPVEEPAETSEAQRPRAATQQPAREQQQPREQEQLAPQLETALSSLPPLSSLAQPPTPLRQREQAAPAPQPASSVPLRTGQWTQEEIAFAKKVIEYFDRGSLPNCTNGTTLRALLSEVLHCSPMRISKKFAGDIAIGKRTFTKHATLDRQQTDELERLELDFHESIQGRQHWPMVRLFFVSQWVSSIARAGGVEDAAAGPERRGRARRAARGPAAGRAGAAAGLDDVAARRARAAARPARGPTRAQQAQGTLRPDHVSRTSTRLALKPPRRLGRLEAAGVAPGAAEPSQQAPQDLGTPEEEDQQQQQPGGATPPEPPPAENNNMDMYGWVPSELGVPDTDPAVLAQILDAERDSRPYADDVARRGHVRGEGVLPLRSGQPRAEGRPPAPARPPLIYQPEGLLFGRPLSTFHGGEAASRERRDERQQQDAQEAFQNVQASFFAGAFDATRRRGEEAPWQPTFTTAGADDDLAGADEGLADADEGLADADEGLADADEGLADADEGLADADEGLADASFGDDQDQRPAEDDDDDQQEQPPRQPD